MQKKILFIGHDANFAGAQYLLLHLLSYLKGIKTIKTTLLLGSGGGLEDQFRKVTDLIFWDESTDNNLPDGYFQKIARVSRLEPFLSGNKNGKPLIYKKIEAFNPDLIFSNTIANGDILHKLNYLNKPFMIYCHEMEKSINTYSKPDNLKYQLSNSAFILTGSKAVLENLVDKHKVPLEKIQVFPSYINCNDMENEYKSVDKIKVKEGLNISDKAIIVGGCGLIEWRKGVDIFINTALQVLKTTTKDVHFIWVGISKKSVEYTHLKYDLDRMGIQNKVHLIESSVDIIEYTACFDLFFMSSREDPYPLVMIEAGLNKIPMVCFDKSGGAVDFVGEEQELIAPYLDTQKASTILLDLIEDKGKREEKGKIFYEKAWAHDISVRGPQILDKILEFELNKEAYLV
ncbi:MAG: glycosyltransferase family 4 protein [Bacteroidota bacterium]